MAKKLGIIQSRGLGDIVIALPIAHYYHGQGYRILWPICESFVSHFKSTVPWVQWIPIPEDSGAFFYDVPVQRLRNLGCDDVLPLYNALTGHPEFSQRPEFQIMGFDQYKYAVAGVPFRNKWLLPEMIRRDTPREQALYTKILGLAPEEPTPNYIVTHLVGSDHRAAFDAEAVLPDPSWQIVDISTQTDSIFDWLLLLERAQSIVCVDSVIANLVDQMNVGSDRYFIPRSHIQLTPVLGNTWTVLEPELPVQTRIRVFGA